MKLKEGRKQREHLFKTEREAYAQKKKEIKKEDQTT